MGFTATQLVKAIRDDGGRVHRMREPGRVYVLTTDPKLAARLQRLGGSTFNPPGMDDTPRDETTPPGGYLRARGGTMEWDIWINTIEVEDEVEVGAPAIWTAAAP